MELRGLEDTSWNIVLEIPLRSRPARSPVTESTGHSPAAAIISTTENGVRQLRRDCLFL